MYGLIHGEHLEEIMSFYCPWGFPVADINSGILLLSYPSVTATFWKKWISKRRDVGYLWLPVSDWIILGTGLTGLFLRAERVEKLENWLDQPGYNALWRTRHSRDRLFLKFSRVSFPAAKVDKLFYSGLWDVNSSLHGKPQMHVQRAANINKRREYFCLRPYIYISIIIYIYVIMIVIFY